MNTVRMRRQRISADDLKVQLQTIENTLNVAYEQIDTLLNQNQLEDYIFSVVRKARGYTDRALDGIDNTKLLMKAAEQRDA